MKSKPKSIKKEYEYNRESDCIIHKETGEVVHELKIIKEFTKSKEVKEVIDSDYILTPWQSDNKFTKLYQDNARSIFGLKNHSCKLIFFWFVSNLIQSDNIVSLNGKDPTNKDIHTHTGLSSNTITKCLKILESKHYIARVGKGKGRKIYVNPEVAFNGQRIKLDTFNIFKAQKSKEA